MGFVSFQDLLDRTCANAAESAELVDPRLLADAEGFLAILSMKSRTSVANSFQVNSETRWLI